ncbi:MAG: carbohydrate ABC transporter permease [Defluviitaleaceae bacterium]|nr:carbohydrate ABC transporter permease [Defluviitaleaceae bacterium]
MTKFGATRVAKTGKARKPSNFARYRERNRASEGYLLRTDTRRVLGNFLMVVLLFGLCFLILQPLFHQFSNAIMSRDDLFDPTVITIPRQPNLANFRVAAELMNYWGSLLTTVIVTFSVAVLQIAACTLVAYGFSRFNFPLKRFWFACVIVTIIVPPHTIMASMFLNFRFFDLFGLVSLINGEPINLLQTVQGYLILSAGAMGLRNGLYIFMLRQYFRNMPKELEESAWVDGCGKLRTFAQIMLPDAVPMLVSCFLFAFVWQWTDGFYTGMFLQGHGVMAHQMSSLSEMFIQYYINLGGTTAGITPPTAQIEAMISTGVLIGIAPIILVYLVAQRFFVESIGQSGIKM